MSASVETVSKPIITISKKVGSHIPDMTQTQTVKNIGKGLQNLEEQAHKLSDFSKYGGVSNKTSRMEIENTLIKRRSEMVTENKEAGSSLVTSKTGNAKSLWSKLGFHTPTQKLSSYLRKYIDNSDSLIIQVGRSAVASLAERISSVFAESETARVVKSIKERQPDFRIEEFLRLLRTYVVPEVLEAFVSGDLNTLRKWCSESSFKVIETTFTPALAQGNIIGGRILDIRDLDLIAAKNLEDIPTIIVSANVQQIFYIKNSNGEVVEGSETVPETLQYIMALGFNMNEANSTGWTIMEMIGREKNSW